MKPSEQGFQATKQNKTTNDLHYEPASQEALDPETQLCVW